VETGFESHFEERLSRDFPEEYLIFASEKGFGTV